MLIKKKKKTFQTTHKYVARKNERMYYIKFGFSQKNALKDEEGYTYGCRRIYLRALKDVHTYT